MCVIAVCDADVKRASARSVNGTPWNRNKFSPIRRQLFCYTFVVSLPFVVAISFEPEKSNRIDNIVDLIYGSMAA